MKLNRILSTALVVVMIFTALIAAFPINTLAAYSEHSFATSANVPEGYEEANLTSEELTAYLNKEYIEYNFETAAEMLEYELSKGYIYYMNSANSLYTLYINKYTGFVYYVNNVTGQILTSNPTNPGYLAANGTLAVESNARASLMSQIEIKIFESANSLTSYSYNSFQWAASRSQITVTPISGGMRVNYVLGDTTSRFLLPGWITADRFEEKILIPMIEEYQRMLEEYCSEKYPDENFSFFDNDYYESYYEYGCINLGTGTSKDRGLKKYLQNTSAIYYKALDEMSPEYKRIDELHIAIQKITGAYAQKIPAKYSDETYKSQLDKMHRDYPITADGTAIYVYSSYVLNETKRPLSEIIKTYCPDYTFSDMYMDERECGYVDNSIQKPVIRCALEYTFNSDGSLSVRLPANSITFDETVYTLEYITPLMYFGCADVTEGGYVFYPDGSGTIIEFEDFYNEPANKKLNLSLYSMVYGLDYAYSSIDPKYTNNEHMVMPVYGLVNGETANSTTKDLYGVDTVTDGYFAVIEEGSAMANLNVSSDGKSHVFATVYASYNPFPSDEFNLSETISVGALGKYTIVSESKYAGSYVTRYVMLTDETVGESAYGPKAYYASDYVGMAAYYRNYLKEIGILETLEKVSDDLPLYIELLGSMEIVDRVLSFPVNKSIPLTSFDDALTIYEELSKCGEYVVSKLNEYTALYEAEKDEVQKSRYRVQKERYEELSGAIEETIDNINFKLTGFVNGGMEYTYPVKVRWEKACGGDDGFNKLMSKAYDISKTSNVNFSVYPDFDFLYVVKDELFDGVHNDGTVAKMVDNRYASKQVYNAVAGEYESFFTLVITADALDDLYTRFNKEYSKYNVKTISLATIGYSANSNFDEEAPMNREEAKDYIVAVLDRMVNDDDYDVMVNIGNVYTLEYATHVLDAPIDSSHFKQSSYTIPFVGMVLHSYVNYSGSPLNYSGVPEYDVLRHIESGAALYYIICYQNTNYMKDDETLKSYYGVDYINWYDNIVSTYAEINSMIGSLQQHEIIDHRVILSERDIEDKETAANNVRLMAEILELVDDQIAKAIDATLAEIKNAHAASDGIRLKVVVDRDALIAQFAGILNMTEDEVRGYKYSEDKTFYDVLDELVLSYEKEYAGSSDASKTYEVGFSSIVYTTKYSYITDSSALDKDYVYTDYTIDNGKVVMVTYSNGESEVVFLLNYNSYPVTVRLDADHEYNLSKYDYVRLDKEVQ